MLCGSASKLAKRGCFNHGAITFQFSLFLFLFSLMECERWLDPPTRFIYTSASPFSNHHRTPPANTSTPNLNASHNLSDTAPALKKQSGEAALGATDHMIDQHWCNVDAKLVVVPFGMTRWALVTIYGCKRRLRVTPGWLEQPLLGTAAAALAHVNKHAHPRGWGGVHFLTAPPPPKGVEWKLKADKYERLANGKLTLISPPLPDIAHGAGGGGARSLLVHVPPTS